MRDRLAELPRRPLENRRNMSTGARTSSQTLAEQSMKDSLYHVAPGTPHCQEAPVGQATSCVVGVAEGASSSKRAALRPNLGDFPSVRKVLRQQEKVAALRDSVLTMRAGVKNQRQNVAQHRRHALDDLAGLMKTLNIAFATGTVEEAGEDLNLVYENVQTSIGELGSQEGQVEDLEDQLSILEYRLHQREGELYTSLKEVFVQSLHDLHDDINMETNTTTVSPGEEGSSDSIPPLLAEYYDKVGDVTVMRERIEELESEHHQVLDGYEARLRVGGVISESDKTFLLNYKQEHQAMLRDLENAQRLASGLREQCIESGLNPDQEDDELALSKGWVVVLQRETDDVQKQKCPALFERPYHGSIDNLMSGFANTRDRINRWLMDILRTTRLEALQHQNTLGTLRPEDISANATWAAQVGDFWTDDEAANGPSLSHDDEAANGPSLSHDSPDASSLQKAAIVKA
ncbi:hypothetical protein B0A49_12249 [Cryomyces minteri]|uniref:Uncharacterized protein n=1 Tax=Cryomyces minteri TaxID=331657 RepID=A0A4U0W719_9PEZI|nr:hypothetical protein B0A49_12249 [Cryomyces minteri]